MTLEERQTTVQTDVAAAPVVAMDPGTAPVVDAPGVQSHATVTRRSMTMEASGAEMARRVVVLLFGLVQAVIILRIVLLLVNARESNGLVSGILDISQVFVGPFEGILRTNALTSGGSILDVAAIVALIGWTLIELGVFAVLKLFKRESAYPDPTR